MNIGVEKQKTFVHQRTKVNLPRYHLNSLHDLCWRSPAWSCQ